MSNKYTFESLKAACEAKGIVLERTGKLIEMTTPDGGTTSRTYSLRDAVFDFQTDPAFSSLPVKQLKTPVDHRVVMSDRRILAAKQTLGFSDRGRDTMESLKEVFKHASGLDSVGGKAFMTLVREFVVNHRRGFLS